MKESDPLVPGVPTVGTGAGAPKVTMSRSFGSAGVPTTAFDATLVPTRLVCVTVTEYADLFTRPVRVNAPAEPATVTVGLPADVAVTRKLVAAGNAAGAEYVPDSVPLPDVKGLASTGAPGMSAMV